ncbi:MAG: 30S ribosomal protein S6 [Planctomycetota bacterium]
MNIYEGMFLLNAAEAARDWDALKSKITDMLTRHGGEIKYAEKWAERKLTYDIAGQSKGVYLLAFFSAPPQSIQAVRGDCRLQRDYILREIFFRRDETALKGPTYSDSEAIAAMKAERMTRGVGVEPAPVGSTNSTPAGNTGDSGAGDSKQNEEPAKSGHKPEAAPSVEDAAE